MKIPRKLSTKWVIALLLVSVIGTAAGVTVLFTHRFPSVPTTVLAGAVLKTTCGTPGALTPSPASQVQGSTGLIFELFNCAGSPAITVAATGDVMATVSVGGVANAAGTIPPAPGYLNLLLVAHVVGATTCSNVGGHSVITGNLLNFPATFPVGADVDYCSVVDTPVPVTALSAFDVQWTQA